jgi:SAM-dependent methyltransferase
MWTPLYWHRRLLYEFVSNRGEEFIKLVRKRFATSPLRVLDVGCGAMPYREIFIRSEDVEYVGADVPSTGIKPSIIIDPKSQRIHAPDASFQGLVHFQVMEHVPDYVRFLSECWRLLEPGGVMLLTVPFAFEFHGVPSDYRRWTNEGLKFDLEQAGFTSLMVEAVESDFLSVLSMCELYLAAKLGYVITKPVFLGLNVLGFLRWPRGQGLIPLTNGALCSKPSGLE